jgi:hypothetical protein
MGRLMPGLPVMLVGLVALVGTGVALAGRDADEDFLLRQRTPLHLTVSDVEHLVRGSAPAPTPDHAANARRASCTPGSRGRLRNPWRCAVRYPHARAIYRLTFRSDGSYVGRHVGGSGIIEGCCVDVADE